MQTNRRKMNKSALEHGQKSTQKLWSIANYCCAAYFLCSLIYCSAYSNPVPPLSRIPTNSVVAPTSQPVAAEGFFFTPAVKIYCANVDTNGINWAGQVARCLIRGGDKVSAERLIPFCNYAEDLELSGLVAAYSGDASIPNARRIRGEAKLYSSDSLARGLVSGLAQQGKYEEAVAISKSEKQAESRLRGIILNHKPTVERVEAFANDFPPDKVYGGVLEYTRALILVGKRSEALRMYDVLTKRPYSKPGAIRLTMVNAFLQINDTDAARKMAVELDAVEMQMVDVLFAREAARKGDEATLDQFLGRRGNILARVKILALQVYMRASSGDITAAKMLCEKPTRESSLLGSRYGMLAAVLYRDGKKDEATRVVEEAAKRIDQMQDAESKCDAAANLIYAAILGIEAYSFGTVYQDLW